MSKVVCKVLCWRFFLVDAPRLGRPVEVDIDQTEALGGNNQHYTIQETANVLRISKSVKLLVIGQ